jgi:dCTP deaminase
MTVLSDVEIERRVKDGTLGITPFDEACLGGAGYDLRSDSEITIERGQHRLAATLERMELPEDLVATLHMRSSLARAGIIASLALVDPGFRGQLTILLFNAGSDVFRLGKGERFVQLVMHRLNMKTERPYHGRYQDSQGIVERRS